MFLKVAEERDFPKNGVEPVQPAQNDMACLTVKNWNPLMGSLKTLGQPTDLRDATLNPCC